MRVANTLSVGVIGAGPGGLALGIFLKKAGFRDFTIFDREDGVGGTWRTNTYPGLACDVKSHLYSFSFDLNANWSRLWSGQPEILEYFERCAQRYDLGPHLKLNTEMTSAAWDAESQTWQLTTAAGDGTRSTSWCRPSESSPSRCCRISKSRSRYRDGDAHRKWDHSVELPVRGWPSWVPGRPRRS